MQSEKNIDYELLLRENKYYQDELIKAEQICLTKLREVRELYEKATLDGKRLLREKKFQKDHTIFTN